MTDPRASEPLATPQQPSAVPPSTATSGSVPPRSGAATSPATEPARRSSVQLVSYGILGAIFVLYAIGWAIALLNSTVISDDTLATVMRAFGVGVAIAAGPLWFACVYVLTRKHRLPVKLLWQALGVVILIPWPFIVGS